MNKNYNPFFQNNLFGIGMMLLHAVALSVLYAVMKELTREISSSVAVFLYKATILIAIIPWCISGGLKDLKTDRIFLHIGRGFLSVCGALSLFYGIKHIGLSDVTAVAYLEHIVLLIVGIVYFKERATSIKFIVIAVSFIGAVLIIKPDYIVSLAGSSDTKTIEEVANPYYVFVFMAIAFWSCNSTAIKILGKTEKTKVQLFYVMLFSSIIAFPVAFMNWHSAYTIGVLEIKYPSGFIDITTLGVEPRHLVYIAVLALCYFLHVIGHFKALKHAELSIVVPFEYSRLIFAAIFGYYFFNETPNPTSYYGYAMISIAGMLLFFSEQKKHRKKKERERAQQEILE
jgi:drug/metabolite transporter (DMT)-like permease